MSVLQYADAFESFLAQIDDYDESYYLIHFIFGLRPEIMRGSIFSSQHQYWQQRIWPRKLELTHQATESHQTHTRKQKTSKAQQKGTQEWRSGRRLRVQQKTCSISTQRQKKKSVHSHRIGCVNLLSTGASEVRAVWMDMDQQLCGDPY